MSPNAGRQSTGKTTRGYRILGGAGGNGASHEILVFFLCYNGPLGMNEICFLVRPPQQKIRWKRGKDPHPKTWPTRHGMINLEEFRETF